VGAPVVGTVVVVVVVPPSPVGGCVVVVVAVVVGVVVAIVVVEAGGSLVEAPAASNPEVGGSLATVVGVVPAGSGGVPGSLLVCVEGLGEFGKVVDVADGVIVDDGADDTPEDGAPSTVDDVVGVVDPLARAG
jgi:hypothetical protein